MGFNNLTDAQAERLAYLIEELAEAQQCACKILRHGYESYNPDVKDSLSNRKDLERELTDVLSAISRMNLAGDISSAEITKNAHASKGHKYMHHQK